jgi:hypothetical protein
MTGDIAGNSSYDTAPTPAAKLYDQILQFNSALGQGGSARIVLLGFRLEISMELPSPTMASNRLRREIMDKLIELEPVELNDAELAAVAGGGFFSFRNSSNSGNLTNSLNNSFDLVSISVNLSNLVNIVL